jgi:hypothetical protein
MTRAPNTRKQHLHSYLNATAELFNIFSVNSASTGVNALGTMFPDSDAVARELGFRSAEKRPKSQ